MSDAGILGNPGIVIISPQTTTINSAPEDNRTSLTGRTWPVGAPFKFGSVEKLYCVLAIQTGSSPYPFSSKSFSCCLTLVSATTSFA